jgi:hypothetical protein
VRALGHQGGVLSHGGAALGVGLGIGAGVGAKNDMQALGYTDAQAKLYGAVTGALTAGVTVFFPPARALVAAAELLRLGVNKFYNEPAEKKAAEGTLKDADQAKVIAEKDKRKKADLYVELAAKAAKEGDQKTAESFYRTALSLRRAAKTEGKDAQTQASDKHLRDMVEESQKKERLAHPERYYAVNNPLGEDAVVTRPKGNAAYEEDGGPLNLGSQRVRNAMGRAADPGLMPVAKNYGDQGLGGNEYYERMRAAEAVPVSGGTTETRVTEQRDGTTVVKLPSRQADHLVTSLKRHNDLKTDYRQR